jgi:hypothetical protein
VGREGLRCLTHGPEGDGHFFEPRMALDGLGQLLHREVNGALADAVTAGVVVEAGQHFLKRQSASFSGKPESARAGLARPLPAAARTKRSGDV